MTPEEAQTIIKANMKDMAKIVQDAIGVLHPELAESEDERIRKELITYLKSVQGETLDLTMSVPKWIAYLEKQKEPTFISDLPPDDKGEPGENGILEKQKEPFKSGRGLYYYDGEKFTYCGYPAMEENPYDFAMSQQEKQKEQKPEERFEKAREKYQVEWSEEDRSIMDGIQLVLESWDRTHSSIVGLPSLIPSYISWLKSLRPSWKPSDEQMKEFLATHPKVEVPDKYKTPDWLFKKQEQQEVDLEKEIDKWEGIYRDSEGEAHDITDDNIVYDWKKDNSQCMNTESYIAFARHFYELGKNSK